MLTYENFTDAYVDLCKLIRDNFDFHNLEAQFL